MVTLAAVPQSLPRSSIRNDAAAGVLALRPLARPLTLAGLLQSGPTPREDIGMGSIGIPLSLRLRLTDARGQALARAAVCLWQVDPDDRALDFVGDELDVVAGMRGMQFSDDAGAAGFRTVYPGRFSDGTAVVYLLVFVGEGDTVTACADICLQLPTRVQGPLRELPVALPLPDRVQVPRWGRGRRPQDVQVPRVHFDFRGPGLVCQLGLALAC
ncbi:MAG: hypothetical protein R3E94_03305 [Burkholderiaceae bacterium]